MNINLTLPNADQRMKRNAEVVLKLLKKKADLVFAIYMLLAIFLLVFGISDAVGPLIGMGIMTFAIAVGRRVGFMRFKMAYMADTNHLGGLSRKGANDMKIAIDERSIRIECNFQNHESSWAIFKTYVIREHYLILNTSSYGYGLVAIDLSVIDEENRKQLEDFVKGLIKRIG